MDPWAIVVVLALIATAGALFLGLLAMSGGDATDRDFSTPLMWTRVGLQAFTVVLLLVALFLRGH
jgi:Hypoxia induced protein conserved region